MKKSISTFVCQECGYESSSWLGKCPECNSWNSLKEFQLNKEQRTRNVEQGKRPEKIEPKTLDQIISTEKERITTGFSEMDNVLGGGIVKGSVILLAGDPGIGKSTLLLQAALNVANSADSQKTQNTQIARKSENQKIRKSDRSETLINRSSEFSECSENSVLYISGEESEEQIKLRANRIINNHKSENFLLLSLTNADAIVSVIEKIKPILVIIDSIQTVESENTSGLSGSVAQVRYCAFSFIRAAKTLNIPVVIVGHVTKEGMVAGPMILSHMVDTVLFLEGEKLTATRILRSLKNRFGPIDEVGIFAMVNEGMLEVKNPEQIFLTQKKTLTPGSVVAAIMEGTRPFLIEIQGLAVFSKLPYPRRIASGIDGRRLELLLAVLQRHCRLPVDTMDVFVNVAGGLKVSDPAVDLGICLAIYSSLKNLPLNKIVGVAEVGLLGELRNVPSIDKRIKEAKKLGFSSIISAKTHENLNQAIVSLSKQ